MSLAAWTLLDGGMGKHADWAALAAVEERPATITTTTTQNNLEMGQSNDRHLESELASSPKKKNGIDYFMTVVLRPP